jgi:RNA polymerase sigma factor (sigma-70 family)
MEESAMANESQGSGLDDVLAGLQSRDETTWQSVVSRHEARLRAVGRTFRLSGQDVEDALQRTWLALLTHAAQIRAAECLGAWLASTMRHECLRELGSAGRSRDRLVDDWAPYEANGAGDDESEALPAILDRRAATARIWDLVERLSPRQRGLLWALYSGDEPSYADVSSRTGMPVGAIGPTRQRALGQLRALIDASGHSRELSILEPAQLSA